MPKIPKHEWGGYSDPESENYAPSMSEIGDDQDLRDSVSLELEDIIYELERPTMDRHSGEENKFIASEPVDFLERLMYLKEDYVRKLKDPELRKNLESKIKLIEQKIYKQFIPFIEAKINVFGWEHSPLENNKNRYKIYTEDIEVYFKEARSFLEGIKISEEDKTIFLNDLDRLKEKLNDYQNEPTLSTFEKIEEEMQEEMRGEIDFDLFLAKAHSLLEIVGRMLSKGIKTRCEARAKGLFEYAKYKKERNESAKQPRDNSKFESFGVDWAWDLLGVKRGASEEDIRKAYRQSALRYHPDINKDKNATEKMRKINEAYEFIKRVSGIK